MSAQRNQSAKKTTQKTLPQRKEHELSARLLPWPSLRPATPLPPTHTIAEAGTPKGPTGNFGTNQLGKRKWQPLIPQAQRQ